MSEKRFTSFIEDDGYWIRDESDFKIIATGLKFGVAENLIAIMNEQQATIQFLQNEIDELKKDIDIYKYEEKKHSETARKLYEENEQLKQKIQRWKNLYDIKDAEVTARVDALNKVCEYYTSEVLFKSDTDPNRAVKEVLNEILNTEVKK